MKWLLLSPTPSVVFSYSHLHVHALAVRPASRWDWSTTQRHVLLHVSRRQEPDSMGTYTRTHMCITRYTCNVTVHLHEPHTHTDTSGHVNSDVCIRFEGILLKKCNSWIITHPRAVPICRIFFFTKSHNDVLDPTGFHWTDKTWQLPEVTLKWFDFRPFVYFGHLHTEYIYQKCSQGHKQLSFTFALSGRERTLHSTSTLRIRIQFSVADSIICNLPW